MADMKTVDSPRNPPPNQILKRERRLRGWTQEYLAIRVGSDPKSVGRWERGEAFPSPYYQQKLIKLFGKTAHELGLAPKYTDNRKDFYISYNDTDRQWAEWI